MHEIYTYAIGFLFIFVVPWTAVAGIRISGCRLSGAICGGILAMASGSVFFLWMLHFGTVGAVSKRAKRFTHRTDHDLVHLDHLDHLDADLSCYEILCGIRFCTIQIRPRKHVLGRTYRLLGSHPAT